MAASFKADYRVETKYPSLTMRHVVKIGFADWDSIWKDDKPAPDPDSWKFKDPNSYCLRRVGSETCLDIDVEVPGIGGPISLVYLQPKSGLHDGQKLEVVLRRTATSDPEAEGPVSEPFEVRNLHSIQLSPAYVADQKLTNGSKRNVSTLATKVFVPQIFTWGTWARSYINVDTLISTDGKDKTSKAELAWGVFERSLSNNWYVPIHLETKLQGNQVAKPLSEISSLGIRMRLPWAATKPALFNTFLHAPVSPMFRFDVQYQRKLRQTSKDEKEFPRKDIIRFANEITWSNLRFLPAENKDFVTLELSGKGWFLPWDRNTLGKQIRRLEGLAEISLLIPVGNFGLAGGSISSVDKEPAKNRIRIKYSAGANEANGFAHSRSISFGFEAVK